MSTPDASTDPHVAVLYSGGLDSAVLVAHLARFGHRVQPIYIATDLVWQAAERAAAERFLAALADPRVCPLVVLELPLADLYGQHWSVTGRGVPAADSPDESVYLPGRNPLLLVKADLWCRLHGVRRLALGTLESNPFADASDPFFRSFSASLDLAAAGSVQIERPLAHCDKRQALRLAAQAPLALTFSCLAPVGDRHCGRCNKCAERHGAFQAAQIADTTDYAGTPHRARLACG